jgi:hypothetical protein
MIFIDLNTQNILVPFIYLLYNEDPNFVRISHLLK